MPTRLSISEHLEALTTSGTALRDAAAHAGLDAPVPTCPTWDVTDLVAHQGMVHRWAAANLRGEKNHDAKATQADGRAASDILEWYSAGLEALIETLQTTPDDAKAMVFLNDAPPPRRFWARRQAHETTIHSADAVAAALQRWPTAADLSIGAELAADGIDELLCGFITRGRGKIRTPEPFTVLVKTSDTGHAWTLQVSDDALVTTVGEGAAAEVPDVSFTGTAAQLYLSLWNRGEEMVTEGREDALEIWRKQVRVRWS
jgi:uncharacterized protein (TIGR03083 family)